MQSLPRREGFFICTKERLENLGDLGNFAKLLKFPKLPILSIFPFFLHAYGAFSL